MNNRWIEGIGNVQYCEFNSTEDRSQLPLLTFTFNRLLVFTDGKAAVPMKHWSTRTNEQDGRKYLVFNRGFEPEASVLIYYL